MRFFYYTGIAIITLFATHSLADSTPVSYWNGPSTSAMNQLVSDFILYNEDKKSSRCPTIQFPSLPGSLIVYKRQVTNLLKPERNCPAKQIFQQDAATLSALQSVDFYAMTAINYPSPYAVHLSPAHYRENIMLCDAVGIPNTVPGWTFTHPTSENDFQFMLTQ